MCECGCTANNQVYTLPQTPLVVELVAGCADCSTPNGVVIRPPNPVERDHLEELPPLPMHPETKEHVIVVGPPQSEVEAILRSAFIRMDFEDVSETLAEDLFPHFAPEAIDRSDG